MGGPGNAGTGNPGRSLCAALSCLRCLRDTAECECVWCDVTRRGRSKLWARPEGAARRRRTWAQDSVEMAVTMAWGRPSLGLSIT